MIIKRIDASKLPFKRKKFNKRKWLKMAYELKKENAQTTKKALEKS